MLFKLHYLFGASGACALTLLLGVFMEQYTDASSMEIGMLLMLMPFTGIICKPIICSKADRAQNHQSYIIICLLVVVISYSPFIIIPMLGPGVYEAHPRACFYVLSVMKVIGDVGFGGMQSIGDALAINYAERIGAQFGTYRIWGSLSWMTFGLLIGQINELPFLPKYVPGFLILLVASLSDALVIWLWPPEYFVMIPKTRRNDNETKNTGQKQKLQSLMPKQVVLSHMKNKLLSALTCRGYAKMTNYLRMPDNQPSSSPPPLSIILNNIVSSQEKPAQNRDQLNNRAALTQSKLEPIDRRTQMKALAFLVRGDLRIGLYLVYFIVVGSGMSPISFFFIGLSKICHEEGTCDFSQLAGALQVSMALIETILFVHIKYLEEKIGRLNLAGISIFCLALKWTFYSTIWFSMSPYWSIMAEFVHGVTFSVYIVLMVEMAHLFASEVECIIPKLIERGVVKEGEDTERLKLSLSATMQALLSSAGDGIGRGFGSLAYGFILERYSFHTLLSLVSVYMLISFVIILSIIIFNCLVKPQLGFETQNGDLRGQVSLDIEATQPEQDKSQASNVDLT